MNVQLGDVIYYVNNGVRPSHGDVQKVNKPKKGWSDDQVDLFYVDNKNHKEKSKFLKENGWEQSWGDDNWVRSDAENKEANTGISTDQAYRLANADNTDSTVKLNCYILNTSDIENNPDMLGEYNVPRAITTFNKRIEPLLIVFNDEIRKNLLVTDPEQRGFFTTDQCRLTNGLPFKPEDQDTVEDLLTITDKEVEFWKNINVSPNYIYDLASEGYEVFV
jgi:hypothetical protein